jgi:methylmalonyl-CoA mutase
MRAARSDFAANFFGCAGFDVVIKPFEDAGQIVAEKADAIVLCSSDAEYPALTGRLFKKQLDLRRTIPVIIAGFPDSSEALKAAGVADFIHIKSNAIEILTKWQQHFGIKD